MPWAEVFEVFIVSHFVGDFLLQTSWQANHKAGGLGGDPESRRALLSHTLTYTLAFVPALIWLSTDIGAWALAVALLIAVPHMVQDDGRLLDAYMRRVKKAPPTPGGLRLAVDQTWHVVVLFLIAVLVGS
ncbi:MAG TPA: DUF3307 domain-containing protein [Solirubrobacterales bacterium]|nr:DUF3307 domain-containing protein [Solirubrobacterales bacterium]